MAKNPNKNPDKGFRGELERAPKMPDAKAKPKFTWHKNVSGGEAKPQNMGTTQRLAKQTAARPADSNLANELANHITKRREKL